MIAIKWQSFLKVHRSNFLLGHIRTEKNGTARSIYWPMLELYLFGRVKRWRDGLSINFFNFSFFSSKVQRDLCHSPGFFLVSERATNCSRPYHLFPLKPVTYFLANKPSARRFFKRKPRFKLKLFDFFFCKLFAIIYCEARNKTYRPASTNKANFVLSSRWRSEPQAGIRISVTLSNLLKTKTLSANSV